MDRTVFDYCDGMTETPGNVHLSKDQGEKLKVFTFVIMSFCITFSTVKQL